ncbi:MAG: putative sulfate exporter family transporter, partial [Chitinophagia bacterium]|nr:putative sulfate exporter family transporter [Chitinophagia bacterium]
MKSTLFTIPNQFRQVIFVVLLLLCAVLPIEGNGNATLTISAPVALVLGLLVALFFGHPYIQHNKKATTMLLQVSVVCLGFGMNFDHAMQAGKEGFIFTVISIAVTLIAGFFIGKWLKIDSNTSTLISSGTAICGGSAIAAVAPIIKANDNEISVSLGTIFILNSIALLIFPPLGHWVGFTDKQFGTWCAIAIHDTSS